MNFLSVTNLLFREISDNELVQGWSIFCSM